MLLKISDLSKQYAGGVQALTNVNLEISNGMFGLLGPNGAGKSTLMRTIATLQEPSSGTIFLDDMDTLKNKDEMRRLLGYLPQDFGFYPKVSAEDMLHHFAILKGITDSKERKELCNALFEQTNLFEVRKRNLSEYSGGMRQRFGIAQALLGNPKVIIVDEPTAGLDPAERNRFHNLLSEIGENTIIILSTHIVDDIKNLCSKMAIMNKGQILLEGKPDEVINQIKGRIWQVMIEKENLPQFRDAHKVISSKVVGGKLLLHVKSEALPGEGFSSVNPDLEDVYFSTIQ